MHFCGGPDDLLYLLMFIPGIGLAASWLTQRVHLLLHRKGCGHDHGEA